MNTADWVPDLFMKRMEARGKWTLFRSSDVPDLHEIYGKQFEDRYVRYEKMAEEGLIWGETMEAIDLWKLMLKALFETGHPWINYKDPCNVRNPQDHVGVIHSSNLCTEITLNTSDQETAVCNLGSIVLDTHIIDGVLDRSMLLETVAVAVRALDNVIDVNFYPTEAARRANSQHRPVGLGVMGLHAALLKQNILFNSEEGLEFNDYFMECIAYFAYSASSDLAAERGTYKSYRGSKWDRGLLPQDTVDLLEEERGMKIDVPRGSRMDWAPIRAKIRRQGMRNSNVLAIAPTATIANIMGTTPCIEPVYKNVFTKANIGGDFIVLNPYLVRDLKGENLWNEDLAAAIKGLDGDLTDLDIPEWIKTRHETVFSVGYESIINAAARRAKWIDQSQSLNLYLESPDLKLLSHMYRKVWHTGLKTTYYLRTLQASKIEKSTVAVKKEVGGLAGRDSLPSILPDVPEVQPQPVIAQHYPEPQVFLEPQAACSIEAMRGGYECEACQ
jgi:ribonucleoside-diphosphate reductase alpha chain